MQLLYCIFQVNNKKSQRLWFYSLPWTERNTRSDIRLKVICRVDENGELWDPTGVKYLNSGLLMLLSKCAEYVWRSKQINKWTFVKL